MSYDLSIVIPVYNEEHRIGKTLTELAVFCRAYAGSTEVIVVDDGSLDLTVEIVQGFAPQFSAFHCLSNGHNQGKGAVVRQGMLAATGDQVLMTDADLSSPLSGLTKLKEAMAEGAAIVIGSRAMPGSEILVRQPRFRELFGKTFNLLVRLLYLPYLRDTQCGFKLFTREAAQDAFSRQRLIGMVFDVEVLYIAKKRGYRLKEVPVVWINSPETRFHATWKNAWQVLRDLISIGFLHRSENRR